MEQLHCEVKTESDGSITAVNPNMVLTILPDGEAKAFNRVFMRHTMCDKPTHAKLNNLAARIQQKKIAEDEAWIEINSWIEARVKPSTERCLVGELDGVRVYVFGDKMIMTKQDLYK